MPEVTLIDQIRRLVSLQKIDVQIYNLKNELRDKPVLLKDLTSRFESKKAGLKALEEKLKAILVERKSFEMDLQSKEDAIVKSNAQLSLIKTNREYTAKLTEIEGIRADKSMAEEKILMSYDRADAVTAQINQEKAVLAEEEKKFAAQKKQIEDELKAIEEKVRSLDAQRGQIAPEVNKPLLSRYERILANKHGLAIVPVAGMSCGGCYMNLPPQVINAIKMHDQMICCEMCTRILYLEDEM
ncbi:MAG: C4-type zinc ribbon domain-containing protein [Candidatus Omnitrophota bacterium]|nr:C4-type zinc ribbon domain-containing protein [Candidatus Omnitrophota bacterium]MDZ4242818.1 C4-type zinc ribbon domain-containing protein [Candidatus Omnitrophota bacterium]